MASSIALFILGVALLQLNDNLGLHDVIGIMSMIKESGTFSEDVAKLLVGYIGWIG